MEKKNWNIGDKIEVLEDDKSIYGGVTNGNDYEGADENGHLTGGWWKDLGVKKGEIYTLEEISSEGYQLWRSPKDKSGWYKELQQFEEPHFKYKLLESK